MFPRSLVILWMVTGAVLAQNVRNRHQRPASHRTLFDETDAFSADSLPSNRARQQATDLGDDMSFNIGPINHGQKPVNKPKTRGKIVAALNDDDDDESVEVKPVVQTIRRYSVENEDGTFTFGYENADGTYKEETRGSDCVVRGKYGYVDPDGVKREFTYETGNPCVPGEERADGEEELNDFRPANPQRRPVKSGSSTPRPPLPARERRPPVPQQRPQPSTASPLIEEDDGETLFVPNRAPVQNRPARPVATDGDDEEAEPVDVLGMKAKAALNSLRNRNQQPAEQQQHEQQHQHQQQQKQQRPPVVVRLNEPVRRRPASQPIESTINFDAEIERLTNSNTAGRPVNANNSPPSAPSDFEAELNRLPAARSQRRRPARPSQRALFTEDN